MSLKCKVSKVLSLVLLYGVLVTIPSVSSNAAAPVGEANAAGGTINASLNVATTVNSVAIQPATASGATGPTSARSVGLVSKTDTSSANAQALTIVPGGVLVVYAISGTSTTFTATGGSVMEGGSSARLQQRPQQLQ